MNMYSCPVCSNCSLVWDPRSGVFRCMTTQCRTWIAPPPEVHGLKGHQVVLAISKGSCPVEEIWFATANSNSSPAVNRQSSFANCLAENI